MFLTTLAFTVLCLVSGSLAAPLTCDDVVPAATQQDLPPLYGSWTLVASSTKVVHLLGYLIDNDSFVLHYNNATFLTTERRQGRCFSNRHNVTLDGAHFNTSRGFVTINGTLYSNSCPDCILVRFILDSPYFNIEHLSLLSRRREVNPEDLREFMILLPCLKFPKHVVMDPTKELCPPPEDFYNSN